MFWPIFMQLNLPSPCIIDISHMASGVNNVFSKVVIVS